MVWVEYYELSPSPLSIGTEGRREQQDAFSCYEYEYELILFYFIPTGMLIDFTSRVNNLWAREKFLDGLTWHQLGYPRWKKNVFHIFSNEICYFSTECSLTGTLITSSVQRLLPAILATHSRLLASSFYVARAIRVPNKMNTNRQRIECWKAFDILCFLVHFELHQATRRINIEDKYFTWPFCHLPEAHLSVRSRLKPIQGTSKRKTFEKSTKNILRCSRTRKIKYGQKVGIFEEFTFILIWSMHLILRANTLMFNNSCSLRFVHSTIIIPIRYRIHFTSVRWSIEQEKEIWNEIRTRTTTNRRKKIRITAK